MKNLKNNKKLMKNHNSKEEIKCRRKRLMLRNKEDKIMREWRKSLKQ